VETLVLVKVVPDVEALRVDPATGSAVREGVPLFVNPFDQRALRVAIDLRQIGETVTVVSMGPAGAAAALHETRGQGADRAILVTDAALAGSDSLVTARVLRRAVDRLGADLILTGRWSTDSETGQVPPQLAELLQRPYLAAARRIARASDGGLEADVDTDDGWAGARVSLPAVVSVGEKIAKPRKLLPEEIAASAALPVEVWSLADLGVDPSTVGRAASPTFVARLVDETTARTPHPFDSGPVPERVTGAINAVAALLSRNGAASSPAPAPTTETVAPSGRFLVLTTGSDGRASLDARDVVAALRRDHAYWSVEAVSVGDAPSDRDRRLLGGAGAHKLWAAPDPSRPVIPENAVAALHAVAGRGPAPAGIAVLSDEFGRSVAGRLSARAGWGLTGDATGIGRDAEGRAVYRKPAFGGRWVAEIGTRTRTAMVTVRPGAFPRSELVEGAPVPVESIPIVLHPGPIRFQGGAVERDPAWGDLHTARVVLIAGQGIGGPEGIRELRHAAPAFGAAVGATRRVVDLGWAPRQLQVGLTGLALEPALAILVGVGGSMNHLVGLRRARTLLAVNRDPAAPVFRHVDVGIVGEWQEVLPRLADELGPRLPALLAVSR
jgi:electron transfer flavoprotein alpha subunit